MLERAAYRKLKTWKDQKKKGALCIIGARQIGKTTLIRYFAKQQYQYFIEINCITEPEAKKIFEGNLDADTIIAGLTAYKMQPTEPGKTLIFFDEIQECPKARSAIKFLVEDGRFDYIESGSLLGVRHREVKSYPVGFEELYYMYPMNFEEFARANGVQESTFRLLREHFLEGKPVTEVIHDTMRRLFLAYVVVGGMPAAVQIYVDTHDIARVVMEQRSILEQYRQDISRYSEGEEKIKVRAIFDSIPSQLDDKNRRFYLSQVDKNGRQNRYENAFLWLSDAGVALPCYNVTEPKVPLQLNEKRNLFKLFLNDTGLLCAACMSNVQYDILNGNLEVNMGSILENVFAQELKSRGFALHYFTSKKYGELDFVIQNGMKLDVIEIKSGNDFKKHPALNHMIETDVWEFHRKIVFCKDNVTEEGEILYLPWYMICFYQMEEMPEQWIYQVDLSALTD